MKRYLTSLSFPLQNKLLNRKKNGKISITVYSIKYLANIPQNYQDHQKQGKSEELTVKMILGRHDC